MKYPFSLSKTDSVIDAGCGYGSWAIRFAQLGAFVCALDLSQDCVSSVVRITRREGLDVSVVRGDLRYLPFRSNTFSKVFSADVIEHLNEDEKAVEELSRVLAEGGLVFIRVPASRSETMLRLVDPNYFAMIGHKRQYETHDLTQLIGSKHLEIILVEQCDFFVALFVLFSMLFGMQLEKQTGAIRFNIYKEKFEKNPIPGVFRLIERFGVFVFPKSTCVLCKKVSSINPQYRSSRRI